MFSCVLIIILEEDYFISVFATTLLGIVPSMFLFFIGDNYNLAFLAVLKWFFKSILALIL